MIHLVPLLPLRYYRLMSRRPFLDVDRDRVLARLPGAFGGMVRWSIPTSEVAVVQPDLAMVDEDGEGWVFERALLIPYAATTSNNVKPNLELYFTRPQRIPKLRYFGSKTIGLPYRQSRRGDGVSVDGLRLRAVDPEEARRILLNAGAEPVSRPIAWLRAHHRTTVDPARVAAVAASRARWAWVVWIGVAAFLGVQAIRIVNHGHYPSWSYAMMVFALVAIFGLPAWAKWRDRRSGTGPGSGQRPS